MDDTRTQQALDELADLFLSGQSPAPTPKQALRNTARDPLSGPAPIRLGPKLRTVRKPPRSNTNSPVVSREVASTPLRLHTEPEESDSPLASIGEASNEPAVYEDNVPEPQLNESSDIDAPEEDAWNNGPTKVSTATHGYTVTVEAVILGNLPGLSGPWLTQYAQLLAQQEGPVAILHVDDDLIDLELVEPTNRSDENHARRGGLSRGVSLRMPPGGGKIDPVSVLEALLDSQDSAPGTILVHLDPQNDQFGLTRAMMIEDWTLMCGADDLAIVGGYRMLKTMVEQNPAVASRHVGLMVMGSDPSVSQEAARKFQSAAESFLKTPVQLLGWQKQMVPVNLRHLGRFEDVANAWPRLAEWFDRYAASEPQAIEEPVAKQEQPVEAKHPQPAPTVETAPKPATQAAPPLPAPRPARRQSMPEPPRFTPRPRRDASTPPPSVSAPEPVAKVPAPAPQVPVEVEAQDPDLVELLMAGLGSVPGGIAMEARCPHQPNTQLLLDQSGRLHLLHRHDSQTDGLEGLQPAMVDLLEARKWVQEHLAILQLTQRQLKFDKSAEPVLHLFTDRADWATALVLRIGPALKLHLLQEVQLGDQRAWFCTPLN